MSSNSVYDAEQKTKYPQRGVFCFLLSVTAATYVAASGREARSDVSSEEDTVRAGAVRQRGVTDDPLTDGESWLRSTI